MTARAAHRTRRRRLATVGHLLRGLLALSALVGIVGGGPWVLARWGHWPIHGFPAWDQVRRLPDVLVSDTAIFGALTAAAWLVWAAFTASVVVEAVALLGGHVVELPVIRPVQYAARTLVASLVMSVTASSSLSGPSPPLGLAFTNYQAADPPIESRLSEMPPPQATLLPRHDEPPESKVSTAAEHSGTWLAVTVGPGDSAWSMAERHLGSGTRWRDIWNDNRHREQPDGDRWTDPHELPRPGWQLRIRGSAPPAPEGQNEDRAPNTQPSSAQESAGPIAYTVQPGDNFWSIAAACLADAWSRPPTAAEVVPYWHDLIDANHDRLAPPGDPNLIFPGQELVLVPAPPVPAGPRSSERPAPSAAPVSPAAAEPSPTTTAPAVPSPPSRSTTTTDAPPSTTTSTQPDPAGNEAPREAPPDSASGPRPPSDTGARRADEVPGERHGSDDEDSSGRFDQVTARVAGVSATLAALALAALARRRSARRRAAGLGATVGPRPAEDVETERSLAVVSGDVLVTASRAVRAFGAALRAQHRPHPLAVTGLVVGRRGDVILYLSDPATPAEPFAAHPEDPAAWLLPAGEVDSVAEMDTAAPVLETLVALGTTAEGDCVMVDLESLGAVTIEGDGQLARRLVRSMLAELSWQPLDHYVEATVVGDLPAPELPHQDVVAVDRLDEDLVRDVERIAAETENMLSASDLPSTAVARAQGRSRDPVVVVVVDEGADPILLNRLVEAVLPGGRGAAVVTVGQLDTDAAQLIVDENGEINIPHIGMTATVVGFDADALHRVDQLVAREPDAPTGRLETPARGAAVPSAGEYEAPPWELCVRVFAACRVEMPDGTVMSFRWGDPGVPNKNAGRGPELLAYLALRPDRSASLDEIREHLWWSRPIGRRSVETLVSGTRRRLKGKYVSRAEGRPDQLRYQLDAAVVTDVDLLRHALAYAQATADGDPAAALVALAPCLDRIEGPAFASGGLGQGLAEWAAAYRVHDQIEQSVVDAALLAATLYQEQKAEGLVPALHAVDQALLACPLNEPLVREAMQLEARLGRRDNANHRYVALGTRLSRDELEPEEDTTHLRQEIMSSHYKIG